MKTLFFLLAITALILAPVRILQAVGALAGILSKTADACRKKIQALLPVIECIQVRTREATAKGAFIILAIIRLALEQLAGLALDALHIITQKGGQLTRRTAQASIAAAKEGCTQVKRIIPEAWRQVHDATAGARAAWIFRREVLAECRQ